MMSWLANSVCPRVRAYPGRMAAKDPRHDTGEGQAEPRVGATDELHDTALHEEIELVGQLVVAATSTPHRLSQREIDKVLGVEREG